MQEQYRLSVSRFREGSASVYELISAYHALQEALEQQSIYMQTMFDAYYQLRELALFDFVKRQKLEAIFLP